MRGVRTGILAAGLALLASSALAEPQTCAARLSKDAGAPLPLSAPLDEPTRLGLSFGLAVALDDSQSQAGAWPRDVIAAAPACPLRTFEAAGRQYVLSGGMDRAPPRFAKSTDGDVLALTILPSIPEAYATYRAGASGNLKVDHPITALVLLRPTRIFVLKLYDGQPADDALVEDMKAAAARTLPVLASFHSPSRALSLNLPAASGRQAFFLRPPSSDNPAAITTVDGDLFRKSEDASVIMNASGFVCPGQQDGFSREDLLVIDTAKGGSDLACRFFGDRGWFSAFVTRFDDGRSEEAQFRTYLSESQKAAKPVGDIAVDTLPRGGHRAVWRDTDGQRQEMWLLRIGKWYVQLRVTVAPENAATIDAAATALIDLARRTVHEASV